MYSSSFDLLTGSEAEDTANIFANTAEEEFGDLSLKVHRLDVTKALLMQTPLMKQLRNRVNVYKKTKRVSIYQSLD